MSIALILALALMITLLVFPPQTNREIPRAVAIRRAVRGRFPTRRD